jgi:hypothetical protein
MKHVDGNRADRAGLERCSLILIYSYSLPGYYKRWILMELFLDDGDLGFRC